MITLCIIESQVHLGLMYTYFRSCACTKKDNKLKRVVGCRMGRALICDVGQGTLYLLLLHLGRQGLTVTPPVGLHSFHPWDSAPITTRKKVANHSPQAKTHLPEINKPQERISGVEVSMCYPIDSNTCIEVRSGHHSRSANDKSL
jgi:hypothetical protein